MPRLSSISCIVSQIFISDSVAEYIVFAQNTIQPNKGLNKDAMSADENLTKLHDELHCGVADSWSGDCETFSNF